MLDLVLSIYFLIRTGNDRVVLKDLAMGENTKSKEEAIDTLERVLQDTLKNGQTLFDALPEQFEEKQEFLTLPMVEKNLYNIEGVEYLECRNFYT